MVSALIDDTCAAGARLDRACKAVGLSERTLQRWREQGTIKDDTRAQAAQRRTPANRITKAERQEILKVANRPEFAHMAPNQIVPALADQGHYIASESTFYRVLREAEQLTPRGKSRTPTRQRPEPFQATAPNQLWSRQFHSRHRPLLDRLMHVVGGEVCITFQVFPRLVTRDHSHPRDVQPHAKQLHGAEVA